MTTIDGPADTSNLGPRQREILLELEKSPYMLIWRGRTPPGAPRFIWTGTDHVAPARIVEPLFERGLIHCRETGRSLNELHVVLTHAGLEYVAERHRIRSEGLQYGLDAWRDRARNAEARIKKLGG